jgi:alanyl-tRNA synthetase
VIKEVAPIVGGGGGGRPNMARAGGRDPSRLDDAVRMAREAIRSRLRDS